MLLHHLLDRAAARHPARPALEDGDRVLTYGELADRARGFAGRLQAVGVRRGDRVGLWLDKSAEAVAALYGVLELGAVYVPIDPSAPPARARQITDDCDVAALVSDRAHADRWDAVVPHEGCPVVCVDDEVDGRPLSPDGHGPLSLDLAYILYTSGSTGVPKGVKLTHRNALAFVEWAVDAFAIGPDDRLSSHAPLHFDLSTFDLFAAAAAGATVVLVPPRTAAFPASLARFIESSGITTWYSVPSVLAMLAARGGLGPGRLAGLRVVLFAGEVLAPKHLRVLMDHLPHARFANLYGPTETNVCTWYEVPRPGPTDDTPIPIGRPIDDVEVFVVAEDGRRCGVDEVGQLLVRGPTVMQGYWGDAARTAATLVPHPFDTEVADRCYRTGDLVSEDARGVLRFHGRADDQVKSRGYRIELADVETGILGHRSVIECAVVPVPDEVFGNRLVAFLDAEAGVAVADVLAFARDRLPPYMLPDEVHIHGALPKTSTGKIDRRALLAVLIDQ